ncbi:MULTISPECIES: prepilin peptidase [unclassified Sphingomonas]|uniref:A24 family peptidase n=1 Tax=unclassified Sphingomonas TaxID=196159 RepID=UPI000E10A539|nr:MULTISPECIES: prepilin peptidase [unclassified Sphingomonas]AXJ96821.1 peptidase [Sphingomonas sp. FARSPH]
MGWDKLLGYALLAALFALLLAAGIEDARRREIANWKNAAIALAAPAWWWANGLGWGDVALQLGVGAAVFALFAGIFAAGWMGGGDVKMIGALALWLPPGGVLSMLMLMAIAGGAITIVMVADSRWRRREGAVEVPYGVAIAAAALLTLAPVGAPTGF